MEDLLPFQPLRPPPPIMHVMARRRSLYVFFFLFSLPTTACSCHLLPGALELILRRTPTTSPMSEDERRKAGRTLPVIFHTATQRKTYSRASQPPHSRPLCLSGKTKRKTLCNETLQFCQEDGHWVLVVGCTVNRIQCSEPGAVSVNCLTSPTRTTVVTFILSWTFLWFYAARQARLGRQA